MRRQDVLFDHDPAVVARALELAQQGGEIDRAFAQLAEQAMPQRGLVVPLFRARARGDLRLAILEVDVPDAVERWRSSSSSGEPPP